jgi:hypothetical protein
MDKICSFLDHYGYQGWLVPYCAMRDMARDNPNYASTRAMTDEILFKLAEALEAFAKEKLKS